MVMVTSSPVASALSFYLTLVTAVPLSIAFAPQTLKRDRRFVVGLIVLVVVAIGAPLFAFDSAICKYAWWAIECWFY